ncbi:MAG: helix-turn-helix domain-containing protein, partial [Prevotellaceae bacterium]|nr:helix-turn-helix domain-containing protein [Prevotellaceae bacterium]MDR0385531.1 helix-turn-helix domain-containing protein [Prevotellaceae bacterium]
KEISYSLAFENVSYFNRLFKTYTGMTPNEYRDRQMV